MTDPLAAIRDRLPPFYAQRFAQAGIERGREPAALARLPLTRRAELLRDQLDHLPLGTRRPDGAPPPVRAGTSGSGDDLLVLAWSAADLARERRAGARVLGGLGIAARMRVANTLAGALATPGSLLLGDVVEELDALDVPLGEVGTEAAARAAWELVDRVEPAVLVLEPATARTFLAAAPGGSRPWWRGIVWLARSALPAPLATPRFDGWERTWLAVPEATSFVGGSCASGLLHVDAEVIVEVVHETTGAALPAGHEGVLALTPLGTETPLLRYASGLRARLADRACACGLPGPALEIA